MKFILSPREACALKIGSLKMAFSPFLNLLEATTLSIFLEVASICLSLCNKLPKCVKSYITALFSEDEDSEVLTGLTIKTGLTGGHFAGLTFS